MSGSAKPLWAMANITPVRRVARATGKDKTIPNISPKDRHDEIRLAIGFRSANLLPGEVIGETRGAGVKSRFAPFGNIDIGLSHSPMTSSKAIEVPELKLVGMVGFALKSGLC